MKEGPFNGRMHFSVRRGEKKKPWITFRTWETWLEHAKAEKGLKMKMGPSGTQS
jgi:hypothetical protein